MKRRWTYIMAAGLACGSYHLAASALAWNAAGHMIVSLVAHEQMNEATQAKAVELIRAHPRFTDHFERLMPREVSRGEQRDKDLWLFAHASTWPDLVRESRGAVDRNDVNRFNRPFWHYINHPVFLDDAERRRLEPDLRLYIDREPPQDRDDRGMNVIQAFKNSSRIVQDDTAPAADRSVHLCWLLHLGGDSHQPLHAAALYTARRFRRGDQGGNLLEIEHNWKLHAFWDDQVSTDEGFGTLRTLAAEIVKDQQLAEIGTQAATSVDIEKWIDESRELSQRFVYTDEVLKKVAAREGRSHLGPLELSHEYRSNAETVAERRAIEAGYRLAKVLEQLFE